MTWQLTQLIASLLVLAGGAELLVAGAASLASRTRASPMLIGLTVVGFGTSTPELCTSLLAGLRDLDDMAVGNVVGSNTFNTTLILGVTAILCPIAVNVEFVRRELKTLVAVSVVPMLGWLTNGSLGRVPGLLMLLGMAWYVRQAFQQGSSATTGGSAAPIEAPARTRSMPASIAWVIGGILALGAGSYLLVDSASQLATRLGFSDLTIGLTVVAAGTSAPELITSVVAAARKRVDLAIGNVFGSNVFNVLGILGLTCVLEPQIVKPQVLALDTPFLLLATLAMFPILTSGNRLSRVEGLLLGLAYVGYVAVLLLLAPRWFP